MIVLGAVCLGAGYFPLRQAYINGPGSMAVGFMCLLAFLTGMGSCSAFSAAIKTGITSVISMAINKLISVAGVNWPSHRGTATAFPLSGFGLSAFFFTTLSGVAFPDDTAGYLLMLAIGTVALVLASLPFMRILPTTSYSTLPTDEEADRRDSNQLHRPKSITRKSQTMENSKCSAVTPLLNSWQRIHADQEVQPGPRDDDEMSSLLSSSSGPGDIAAREEMSKRQDSGSLCADITGFALFTHLTYWQLFAMMAILAGIGLMTIKYCFCEFP